MSAEWIVLLLRLVAAACLMGFVGMAGWMLWQDYQQAIKLAERKIPKARLIVIASETVPVGKSWTLAPITTLGSIFTEEQALILWQNGVWRLQGINGGNILLNDHRIETLTPLTSGDIIKLGDEALQVEFE